MKAIATPTATAALMLAIGVGATYAQQRPVTGSFSGNAVPSASVLQANTTAAQYDLTGAGSLGSFTVRAVTASTNAPQPPSATCSGPMIIHGLAVAGAAVFQTQDGSLLMGTLTHGDDCIDLSARLAHCTRTFQINRGTGRFKNAAGGTVTLTFTVLPEIFDISGNPVLNGITDGELKGTVSGVSLSGQPQNGQQ
jgi:hypothetical protein